MNKINKWLDISIKNEYYYTHFQGICKDANFRPEWHDALISLRKEMSNTWTKDEYLIWVRTWKLVYSKLTGESQMNKRYRSSNRVMYHVNDKTVAFAVAIENLDHFRLLRSYAFSLLILRADAKKLAEEAYQAEKAKEAKKELAVA